MAAGFRRCERLALRELPGLRETDFPPPFNIVNEDVYFASINAWGKNVPWIAPGEDLGGVAGVGVSYGHVVYAHPHPKCDGEYVITYFNPGDVGTLAGWLTKQADDADEQAVVHDVMNSVYRAPSPMTPTMDDIEEIAHRKPWPPPQAETIVPEWMQADPC
jgi:hypothetical protein